ncbi:MAG TPA: zinc ribbon domain-containing protein [Rhodothermales bacterium]|nr:zinc ribbon domain-containing protein [Rhodothermales bacterium]
MATKPATFECPSCALEVEAGLDECPYCGYEFPRHRRGVPLAAWLFGLLLLLPLLWALFTLF